MLQKLFILLLFILFIRSNLARIIFRDESCALNIKCNLHNGKHGTYKELRSCKHVQLLAKEKRLSEIESCGFIGSNPIVCCPESSQKFKNALCQDLIKPLPLNMEFNIIGGKRASVGEFPFQAALGIRIKLNNGKDSIKFNCGGSIIADDIVLTAAHCVREKALGNRIVRLGRTSLNLSDPNDNSGPGEDIEVMAVKIHQKYSTSSRHNDKALIKLKHPTTFSEFLQTICITSDDEVVPDVLVVTGFGVIDPNTGEKSSWLQKGYIEEYSFDECQAVFKNYSKEITDSQFCGTSLMVDSCQGDSGGPLSYKLNSQTVIYGIVSYGFGCGNGMPAAYTKVSKYLDWLEIEMTLLE